jgi:Spy/CpxP family protein refolding chaperone
MSDQTDQPRRTFAALALSALLLCVVAATTTRAQDKGAQPASQGADEPESAGAQTPEKKGAGLLASLNLSPEQREQIRAIRLQTEREGRPLLVRMRQARRALDAAIYSDNTDESIVAARLREFTAAQAEVARLRAFTELRVRRVLMPEQLNTLREMRRQALLQQREMRRKANGARPNQRDGMNRRRLQQRLSAPAVEANPTPNPSSAPRERRDADIRRKPRP